MLREATLKIDRTDIANAIIRLMLGTLLIVHAVSQLIAFWPEGLDGAADVLDLANVVVATAIMLGAILLIVGYKTNWVATALMVLVAVGILFDLVYLGEAGSALDFLPRLVVMIGLLLPAMTGGEGMSIDGRA